MRTRDVATVAFRVLALWIVISAVTALIDLLFNWKTIAAQVMGSFSGIRNAPTEWELFWMSASAFVGRGLIGVLAWWLSPALARVTPFSEGTVSGVGRRDLYAAGSFLIGLYLVAISAPGLAFEAYVAMKQGYPAYPEAHPQVPLLLAQLALGIALIRGRWLVSWATSEGRAGDVRSAAEDAVQQDEADEAPDG